MIPYLLLGFLGLFVVAIFFVWLVQGIQYERAAKEAYNRKREYNQQWIQNPLDKKEKG